MCLQTLNLVLDSRSICIISSRLLFVSLLGYKIYGFEPDLHSSYLSCLWPNRYTCLWTRWLPTSTNWIPASWRSSPYLSKLKAWFDPWTSVFVVHVVSLNWIFPSNSSDSHSEWDWLHIVHYWSSLWFRFRSVLRLDSQCRGRPDRSLATVRWTAGGKILHEYFAEWTSFLNVMIQWAHICSMVIFLK